MPLKITKQQFRNEDNGWVGVQTIQHNGAPKGMAVRPGDTVFLSEDEQALTANAPRDPAHNPFIEQVRVRRNPETDAEEEILVTPLVPVNESRPIPGTIRPIGSDRAAVEEANASRAVAPPAAPPAPAAPAPGGVGTHPAIPTPPVAPEPPVAPAPAPQPPVEPPVPPRAAAAAAAAPAVEEEIAVKVDPEVGEETGAAQAPSKEAEQGEYAQHEEVGTPDAPQQSGPPTTPVPWTPGSSDQPNAPDPSGG